MAQPIATTFLVKPCKYCFQNKCLVTDPQELIQTFDLDPVYYTDDLFTQLKQSWFEHFRANWGSLNVDEVGVYYYSEQHEYMIRLDDTEEEFFPNCAAYGYQDDQTPNLTVYICPVRIVDQYNNQKQSAQLIPSTRNNQWRRSEETVVELKVGILSDQFPQAGQNVCVYPTPIIMSDSITYGDTFTVLKRQYINDLGLTVDPDQISMVVNHGTGFFILDRSNRLLRDDMGYIKRLIQTNTRQYHLLVYVLNLSQISAEHFGNHQSYSVLENHDINTPTMLQGGVMGPDSNWASPSSVINFNIGIAGCQTCSVGAACYKGLVYSQSLIFTLVSVGMFTSYDTLSKHIRAMLINVYGNSLNNLFSMTDQQAWDAQLLFFDGHHYYSLEDGDRMIYQDYGLWKYIVGIGANVTLHLCPKNSIEPGIMTTGQGVQITPTSLNGGTPPDISGSSVGTGFNRFMGAISRKNSRFQIPEGVSPFYLPTVIMTQGAQAP